MVPPVPIPNTVVKHLNVESTWVATPWEDRELPVQLSTCKQVLFCCLLISIGKRCPPGGRVGRIPRCGIMNKDVIKDLQRRQAVDLFVQKYAASAEAWQRKRDFI